MARYLVKGQEIDDQDAGFGAALAAAHAGRHRPLCLCIPDCAEPAEMYIARLPQGYVIKRMPFTGPRHAPSCASYEPPDDGSGRSQVMGSAITEDPASGTTTLKLAFPLLKAPGRNIPPGSGTDSCSVCSDGTRLTLRGLLHYLWDEAHLTHWHPGFEGKRSWGTVRKLLLNAAQGKVAKGQGLEERLYIPEPFTVEQRDAINARRRLAWARGTKSGEQSSGTKPLMLLIAEVKEITPGRHSARAMVKHVPDQGFALDAGLYGRLERRFEQELSLWAASPDARMVMASTFSLNGAGVPVIEELSLMPTTGPWLPVESAAEQALVERLVDEKRAFRKTLRYNLPSAQAQAAAILTDAGTDPVDLLIASGNTDEEVGHADADLSAAAGSKWRWVTQSGPMPSLPPRARFTWTPTGSVHA